jgi:hypothetical protein
MAAILALRLGSTHTDNRCDACKDDTCQALELKLELELAASGWDADVAADHLRAHLSATSRRIRNTLEHSDAGRARAREEDAMEMLRQADTLLRPGVRRITWARGIRLLCSVHLVKS